MATMKDILSRKGSTIHSVPPDASVLQAVEIMTRERVGAVLVTGSSGLLGIFTERDLLRRVVGGQRSPASTPVSEVMTAELACGQFDTPIEEARAVMMNRRIRHLPILSEEGELQGVVSIGDLNAWELDGREKTIRYLHDYIYGRA